MKSEALLKGGAKLLLLFFLLKGTSCNQENPKTQNLKDSVVYVNFKKESTYKPPMAKNQTNFRTHYFHLQNDSIITLLDRNNKFIRYWNINKQEFTDSINVDVFGGYDFIWGYKILSKDSIILSYNTTYFGNYHDNAVILIDSNQNMIGKFNFEGAPVPMVDKNPTIKQNRKTYTFENDWSFQRHTRNFPLIYNKNINAVLTTLSKFHTYPASYNQVIAGWVYLDSTKKFNQIPISFTPDINGYFPHGYVYFRGDQDEKGNVFFGTGYSSKIKKYNLHSEKYSESYVNFYSIDTIKPKDSLEEADKESNKTKTHEYKRIRYDKFNDVLWRTARIATQEGDPPMQINYPLNSIIMFNRHLNKVAEGFLPPHHRGPVFPYNGGLLVYDQLASDESERITFSYLKYELDTISKDSFSTIYRSKKSSKNLTTMTKPAYLNEITSNSNFKDYILLPWNNTCPACRDGLMEHFSNNPDVLENSNTGIVILGSSEEKFQSILKKHNLERYKNRYLFSDASGKYKTVMPQWVNLKHIRLNEEGAIIKNEQIGPGNLKQLLNKFSKDTTKK